MDEKSTIEVRSALNSSLLTNAKLAKAVEVMVGYHLSTKEKVAISRRIDGCSTLEELEGTMNLINKELHKGFADPETAEKWSPQFVEDIKRYYEEGFPFNPLAKLSTVFSPIKEFIILQEVFIKMEDGPRKELMLKELEEQRELCNKSIKEFEELLSEMGS